MKSPFRSLALVALGSAWLAAARATDLPARAAVPGDMPCKIHQSVAPVFPVRLLRDGIIRGEVQLMLEVDPVGRLTDLLVTAYTHREFAEEVLRAVRQWLFEPGHDEGRPVVSILGFTFNFETAGVVVIEKHSMPSRLAPISAEDYEYRVHGLATLDRELVPLHQPGPVYPREWIEQGRTGTVVIDFFIDETGQARLPVIQAHPDAFLASAAVATVKEWRFKPPTCQGRPVLARAQQVFVFQPKTKGGTSS
jgi:TonB family protein